MRLPCRLTTYINVCRLWFWYSYMHLKYTASGHLVIFPEDDCNAIVDIMLATDYSEEFCIAPINAPGFSAEFTRRLMEAGFLVMSALYKNDGEDAQYIFLPKLHLVRSALFFENLHIKKSIRRLLNRYELRPDCDFSRIVDLCIETHGDDWLTPPLMECIKKMRDSCAPCEGKIAPAAGARPVSFALYRGSKLVAGEFGIICGRVYTSYSGYYSENNAGTVQLILTARCLQEHGFSFFDLGMPLDYKTAIGAQDISPQEFVRLFRWSNF